MQRQPSPLATPKADNTSHVVVMSHHNTNPSPLNINEQCTQINIPSGITSPGQDEINPLEFLEKAKIDRTRTSLETPNNQLRVKEQKRPNTTI